MTSAHTTARAEADRCPGVLRPHRAADGALLRLRLPGGRLPAGALAAISAAAVGHADGDVQLTSRANLQLRGVATGTGGAVAAGLVDEVVRAGFLPQPSHERVRNIMCSPLTGLLGGLADLRSLTDQLDRKLCAAADLAELPGPFLFILDDGRGDVAGLTGDLGVCAVDSVGVRLRVGGLLVGPVLTQDEAAGALIELARRFLPFSQDAGGNEPVWHVRELPLGGRELLPPSWSPSSRAESFWSGTAGAESSWVVQPAPPADGQPAPFGRLIQDDGQSLLSVLVPLGLLPAAQVDALVDAAELGAGELIVTPWRGVLVPGLLPADAGELVRRLTAVGLELAADPPWRGITACTGAPRCAHGQGETRGLATSIADLRRAAGGHPALAPVHLVGCERRCGTPGGEHIEVLNLGRAVEIAHDGVVVVVSPGEAPAAVAGVGR